ncbi:MAG: hypothetical protein HHJ14_04905 [Cellulomonas sp.]|nr:hypothetical protein [Cellulomonas sp.]
MGALAREQLAGGGLNDVRDGQELVVERTNRPGVTQVRGRQVDLLGRIVTVSVEKVRIVKALPPIDFSTVAP